MIEIEELKYPAAHWQRQADLHRGPGIQGGREHEAVPETERARLRPLRLPAPLHRLRHRGLDQLSSYELVRIKG